MDLGLRGQVAVVVGAASGIGRAIATGFAAEGCAVALTDRSPSVAQTADAGRGGGCDRLSGHAGRGRDD
jgi:2-hydroxycyclohexanecarboxyl-CoA dehydrogenase